MKRGEVWWASLSEPSGSEPGYRRPVVIVQADEFNRSNIRTVIAATITSNLALASAPGNVRVPKRGTGLGKVSVVNVSQIITLDKSFLVEKAGRLSESNLQEVEVGLRLVFAL
ncbi:MAG: type II toxin-antitoxin system PemK/MazF family toxin [Oceanicoccus sp.]|uniref:type II toxin-antitoxin system PemK/MazF family toxin n=1 Tax=Oceanicoccus sp. TaxID=2691044 RepID=UPI00337BBCBE|nr:type II toxin-antitoxin system PemK/MazF family toxin [Oceanicoccus sp.]